MSKLTEDMTSLEREYRERLADYRRTSEAKEREREDEWRRKMEDVKEDARRKVDAAEGKVTAEEAYVSKKVAQKTGNFDVVNVTPTHQQTNSCSDSLRSDQENNPPSTSIHRGR